jgi:peptidoglycan/xylan/chitin deacetylase (PgdA/CDA1 family)
LIIDADSLEGVIDNILRWLKTLDDSLRLEMISDIFEQLSIVTHQIEKKESRMLTWDMVRTMSEWGIEFGSHSVTHPLLSKLNDKKLCAEVLGSKQAIEKNIQKSCFALAYPVGGTNSFNEKVIATVASCDYDLACTYLSGINRKDKCRPYELKRLHVDATVNFSWFKGILTVPVVCAADFKSNP